MGVRVYPGRDPVTGRKVASSWSSRFLDWRKSNNRDSVECRETEVLIAVKTSNLLAHHLEQPIAVTAVWNGRRDRVV